MAGFLGVWGGDTDGQRLGEALRLIHHHLSFCSEILTTSAPMALGVSYHDGDSPTFSVNSEMQVAVGVYGAPVDPACGQVVDAEGILNGYLDSGTDYLTSLDSAFVVIVADRRSNLFFLVNDPMATVPLHYALDKGGFAFAPEGKAVLALLEQTPGLDVTGALEFLAMGHAVRGRTLFDSVRLLEPASIVEVDLVGGQVKVGRYWDLVFSPNRSIGLAEASETLHEVLRQSLDWSMSPAPHDYSLLLTGGYDSRAALTLLVENGCPPARCLTWGVRDDIEFSDVPVARELAGASGVSFQYLHYDGDMLAANAAAWLHVNELGSDNMGGFAAGPDFMYDVAGLSSPMVVNGDQLFGLGGIPVSHDHAVEFACGIPASGLGPGLADIVKLDRAGQAAGRVRAGVDQLIGEHRQDTPKNLLDYLGYRFHLARWLNNPAYFREPMVSVRRPLLQRSGMDFFQQLPEALRVDKRLLIEMQKRHMPGVLEMPVARANCLVDWDHWMISDPECRTFSRELLDAECLSAGELGLWLDPRRIQHAVDAYFSRTPRPMSRRPERATLITRLRRRAASSKAGSMAVSHAQRLANRLRGRSIGVSRSRVVKRLMLLGLFLRMLDRGGFSKPALGSVKVARSTCNWIW